MSRRLILALILMLSSAVATAQDLPVDRAREANSLYESGNVNGAVELFESLIASQIHDASIYINLGHAYFTSQNLGSALLNYRRAQQMNPRDPELGGYLARVRTLRVDVQGDDAVFIDSLAALTSGFLTLSELGWLALGLWLCFFVCLNVLIVNVKWRNNLRGPLLVLMILTISIITLWTSRAYVERFRPAAIIMPAAVTVRSGPGDDYLDLYELHAAAEIRILETQGVWVRFGLPDGRQGWIAADDIEVA